MWHYWLAGWCRYMSRLLADSSSSSEGAGGEEEGCSARLGQTVLAVLQAMLR